MPRIARKNIETPFLHVMVQGVNKEYIFNNDEYIKVFRINCIKYIHENPVKAGIVTDAGDYKYSSYNNYINNVGECQSQIMKEIFGENCDYQKIFKKAQDMRFMDNEKKREDLEYYMKAAINEFMVINKVDIVDIFADRKILKLTIRDLKKKYNYSYEEICEFFGITKSRLESLKKINIEF